MFNTNNFLSVTSLDRSKVQRFIFNGWGEFFDLENIDIDEIISKRKDLQDIENFYKKYNGNFWYLQKNNKVIATIAVHEILFMGKKVGFLRRFFIEKNYRNKGLGTEILKFIEDYCRQKKWSYLMFGVDKSMERNKNFYFRNGYEEFSKNIPQDLLDDNDTWYLRKKISL